MLDTQDPILQFTPLWGAWQAEALIGEGSYGRVYCITREDLGGKYFSALKHIHIPRDEVELQDAKQVGMEDASLSTYFGDMAAKIVSEINTMYTLRGQPNIVAYEDHLILHEQGTLTWDVFLRMELLLPLPDYLEHNAVSPEDVRRLGADMCAALAACHKKGILHRDIKDGNIFLTEEGSFKLGDFGIARTLSANSRSMTMRGTPVYLAPEIFHGRPYDAAVDIYSLGILLYKLLNNKRYPFLPAAPAPIGYGDVEQAFARRMQGEQLPPPAGGDPALQAVVLKACAYDPKDRYHSADALRAALLQNAPAQISTQRISALTAEETTYLRPAADSAAQAAYGGTPPASPTRIKRPKATSPARPIWKPLMIGAAAAAGVLAILLAGTFLRKAGAPADAPPYNPPYDPVGIQAVTPPEPPVFQPVEPTPGYVHADFARVHYTPDPGAEPPAFLTKNAAVSIVGEREGWYEIICYGETCYIPAAEITKGALPPPQPAADGGPSYTYADLEGAWFMTTPTWANVYIDYWFEGNTIWKTVDVMIDGELYTDCEYAGTYEIRNGNTIVPYVLQYYYLPEESPFGEGADTLTIYPRQIQPFTITSLTEDTMTTPIYTFMWVEPDAPPAPAGPADPGSAAV